MWSRRAISCWSRRCPRKPPNRPRQGATRRSRTRGRPALQSVPDPRHLGRGGRDRPAYRARAGDERRLQLRIEPVQPRDPGQAAARLVDQAVRLSDRARKRLHAVDAGRRLAGLDQPGAGHAALDAGQLQQQQLPRADAAARRARKIAEHGDGAARRDAGHGGDRRRRSRNSASWTTCRASTRWRSAPARRRRCATPRPMRCSPTAASASRRR